MQPYTHEMAVWQDEQQRAKVSAGRRALYILLGMAGALLALVALGWLLVATR